MKKVIIAAIIALTLLSGCSTTKRYANGVVCVIINGQYGCNDI